MSNQFTRVAVLIDLSFFLDRYNSIRRDHGAALNATEVAAELRSLVRAHVSRRNHELHRIFVYDCRPLQKRAHNPLTRRAVDFSKTATFTFRTELLSALAQMRKVALRLGELADRRRWRIKPDATHRLLSGVLSLHELTESDVAYDVEQKGVDIKMGLDIATLAYKRLVDRIVLVTGDSDFVPAPKLARREGIDVVLDPLWATISPSLSEHIDGLQNAWPQRATAAISSSA